VDRPLDAQPRNALIFVDGFTPAYARSISWSTLDQLLALLGTDRGFGSAIRVGTQEGYRFQSGNFTCDVFEVMWDDRLDRLSDKPLMFRVLRTAALVFTSLPKSAREILGPNRAFAFQTLSGLIAIIFFAIFTILSFFGLHQIWFTLLALLFASTSVAMGDVTDVVDAYHRYLLEPTDTLRLRLRNRAIHVFDEVHTGSYSSVTIVAHSFGALLAIDAIPHAVVNNIRLATVGASFSYIHDLEPVEVSNTINTCVQSGRVARWVDVTSTDDPVAGGIDAIGSIQTNADKRPIELKPNRWEYITGEVHDAYFSNGEVRSIIQQLLQ
jgi:hypothetical protein